MIFKFKMYKVTGGINGNSKRTVSTEVMSSLGSTWTFVGNLPRASDSMIGISVNNQMFVTGMYL